MKNITNFAAMITVLLTALIVALICWAIWGAFQPGGLLEPFTRYSVLDHDITTMCPKCMPTLYTPIVCCYLMYFDYPVELHMLPLIWLLSSGVNALIIKYLET